EKRLARLTPDEFKHDAHHWLILHGRYVCKARRPDCPDCIIADCCEYCHKTPRGAGPSTAGAAKAVAK
ncbi:MAG: endonuclease III domain-containing protein, partial [Woeseiaceae bacterium]